MNPVQVKLKIETEVVLENRVFLIKEHPISDNSLISVYITDGEVSCFVGKIETKNELLDLVGPENIVQTLNDVASEYQWDALYTSLQRQDFVYHISEHILLMVVSKSDHGQDRSSEFSALLPLQVKPALRYHIFLQY